MEANKEVGQNVVNLPHKTTIRQTVFFYWCPLNEDNMIKMQNFTMDKPPFCVSERLSAKKRMTTILRSIYILSLDSHIGSLMLHREFRGVIITITSAVR